MERTSARWKLVFVVLMSLMICTAYMSIPQTTFASNNKGALKTVDTDAKVIDALQSELEQDYVYIERMGECDANCAFSSDDDSIKRLGKKGWKAPTHGSGWKQYHYWDNSIVYYGKLNWGSANASSDKNATLGKTTAGTATLRWTDGAELLDENGVKTGEKADVIMQIKPTIYVGARPSTISKTQKVYVGLTSGAVVSEYSTEEKQEAAREAHNYVGYKCGVPRTSPSKPTTAIKTTSAVKIATTIKIVESGTDDVIAAEEYPTTNFAVTDLDVVDHTIKTSASEAAKVKGEFAESVAMRSGIKSDVVTTEHSKITNDTDEDGNERYRPGSDYEDDATFDSGFAVSVQPQGYSYTWRGSTSASAAVKQDDGRLPSRSMGTKFGPFSTYALPPGEEPEEEEGEDDEPETYSIETEVENGTIDPPIEDIEAGETKTITYRANEGYQLASVTVDDEEQNIATCKDSFTFSNIDDNHYIVVVYEEEAPQEVTVSYEWEGDHPEADLPDPETNEAGFEHEVDTTYSKGDTVAGDGGIWTFNGWDKSGTITVNENTVIKGSWTFTNQYRIDTSAENGTITDDIDGIQPGEERTITYSPNDGYQLSSIVVDGEEVDPSEYPASYKFEDINSNHTIDVVFDAIPQLSVTKTANKKIVTAGDTVTYTVVVKQTVNNAEAKNVVVEDTLPKGLTLVENSFTGSGYDIVDSSSNSYKLSIESLKSELTYTYKAVTTKGVDASSLINKVSVTAENTPSTANDEEAVKSLTPKPQIEKSVSNDTPEYGEKVTYTISVKEPQEGISVRNAIITDKLPKGLKYVENSISVDGNAIESAVVSDGKITVKVPDLSDEVVIQFDAKVTENSGKVKNTAVLAGDGISNKTDDATVNVGSPKVTFKKSVKPEKAKVGDNVTYTLNVKNELPLTDVKIVDTPAKGMEIDIDSVEIDEDANYDIKDGKLVINMDKIKGDTKITYTAKVKEKGKLVNTAKLTAENLDKSLTSKATVTVSKNGKDGDPKTGQSIPWIVVGLGLIIVLAGAYLVKRRISDK